MAEIPTITMINEAGDTIIVNNLPEDIQRHRDDGFFLESEVEPVPVVTPAPPKK